MQRKLSFFFFFFFFFRTFPRFVGHTVEQIFGLKPTEYSKSRIQLVVSKKCEDQRARSRPIENKLPDQVPGSKDHQEDTHGGYLINSDLDSQPLYNINVCLLLFKREVLSQRPSVSAKGLHPEGNNLFLEFFLNKWL